MGLANLVAGALAILAGILCLMWLSSGRSGTLSGLVIVGGLFCGILNANLSTLAMGMSSHGRSVASGAFNSLRFIGGAFAPITAGYLGQNYGATVPFLLGALAVVIGLAVLLGQFEAFEVSEPEPTTGD